jgi:3-oxoacyl-[acyl-carrier protein] reductase/meso-butanediol dehydrogenase/(S,S)-butanediol dehydrogenase/diacetyl reductase
MAGVRCIELRHGRRDRRRWRFFLYDDLTAPRATAVGYRRANQHPELETMEKSVVVTGGNRGIGRDIAEAFVDAGYFVVIGARHDSGVTERFGDRATFVQTDVRDPVAHMHLTAVATQGRSLHCYVNNAGFSEWRPLDTIDDAFLDDLIATNLKGAFWGCKAAAAALGADGSIINVSSLAGKRGSSNNAAYCATKFGVNGMTQALCKELGPSGIRVNAVCPVLIATDGLIDALHGPYAPAQGDPHGFIERFAADNAALKRLPTGPEVGAMCVFLASDAASAITGQCITVDCGVFPQ